MAKRIQKIVIATLLLEHKSIQAKPTITKTTTSLAITRCIKPVFSTTPRFKQQT